MTNTIRVTAADFNGSSFDSCPFTATPGWLKVAFETGKIKIKPDDRDYALWDVEGVIAFPGDSITKLEDGRLIVTKWKGDGK